MSGTRVDVGVFVVTSILLHQKVQWRRCLQRRRMRTSFWIFGLPTSPRPLATGSDPNSLSEVGADTMFLTISMIPKQVPYPVVYPAQLMMRLFFTSERLRLGRWIGS